MPVNLITGLSAPWKYIMHWQDGAALPNIGSIGLEIYAVLRCHLSNNFIIDFRHLMQQAMMRGCRLPLQWHSGR